MNGISPVLRLLVVDDHPLIRLGFHQLVADQADLRIAAEAESGVDALRLLEQVDVDVVVLDMAMPGRSGIEILRRIRARASAPPVLIYSRFPAEQYALRTQRAGAAGYVNKGASSAELLRALRAVAAGERVLPEGVARELAALERRRYGPAHEALSDREFEVLRLLVTGRSVSAIAQELSLSIKTVSTHRTRLLRKLALSSTADLVHYAIDHGLDDSRI